MLRCFPLLPSAFTVALLAAVESLLSAVVADGMSGDRHNSNVELIAQGAGNPGLCCCAAPGANRRRCWKKRTFVRHIGRDNILPHVHAALERAREIHSEFDGLGSETAGDLQSAPI